MIMYNPNYDYNDVDIKLSEKILKFCEVKNNSSSEIYNNFKKS